MMQDSRLDMLGRMQKVMDAAGRALIVPDPPVYDSADDFRCHECLRAKEQVAGSDLVAKMWLPAGPSHPGKRVLTFVVMCFAGHVSLALFRYHDQTEAEEGPKR